MSPSDLLIMLKWWLVFFVAGLLFLPITSRAFTLFFDKGYLFAKIIGVLISAYLVFLVGTLHLVSFTSFSAWIIMIIASLILFLPELALKKQALAIRKRLFLTAKEKWLIFAIEEVVFLLALYFWANVRTYQPDIHGLEKYMDFGFINSILRAAYFPPFDMWFPPLSINYYYFGHLVTAFLTKISNIPSSISYNLMLATIFAFTFTLSFSIAVNLIYLRLNFFKNVLENKKQYFELIINALLVSFLVSLAGNIHTLYAFFKPYVNEKPVPFWDLLFSFQTFPNQYWYPNATRFISNTIHEFPIYSFVVSDLHGHVLSIPIVLTIIAFLLHEFMRQKIELKSLLIISFLLAAAYMTNVWDAVIYLLLASAVIFYILFKTRKFNLAYQDKNGRIRYWQKSIKGKKQEDKKNNAYLWRFTYYFLLVVFGFFVFSLPFSIHFKPFVSGIGVLCAPKFLTDLKIWGPFLFEENHCQRSPLWQMSILYGFFYFCAASFIAYLAKKRKALESDIFILLLIAVSTLLIIIPEFIYIKDIYPAHYRANTMFKLVYQSFIMLSIASGYIIVRLILVYKPKFLNLSPVRKLFILAWFLSFFAVFSLVSIYPFFAINSYYENFRLNRGLDGTTYLKQLYPSDYEAILWLNKNIKGQPVILEAQGDSYTDFERISANTGLPTVLGWTVHEWLWRGTYDIPAPRITEVKDLYESNDLALTKTLIKKYNISLVIIGGLERQKYPLLNEAKFKSLGNVIFEQGSIKIIKLS